MGAQVTRKGLKRPARRLFAEFVGLCEKRANGYDKRRQRLYRGRENRLPAYVPGRVQAARPSRKTA
jgi:hypothetical protein